MASFKFLGGEILGIYIIEMIGLGSSGGGQSMLSLTRDYYFDLGGGKPRIPSKGEEVVIILCGLGGDFSFITFEQGTINSSSLI